MLIAHLTDLHIGISPQTLPGNIDPTAAFQRALVHVRQLDPAPEIVLLSGDLTDSGNERDYAVIRRLLEDELPEHMTAGPRVLVVPGNHDDTDTARKIMAPYMPQAADAPASSACLHVHPGGLHIIGLDTRVPGQAHGELPAAQLGWLERTLQACAGQPVLIFMHHPPLTSGISVMDGWGLRLGRDELARLVAAHGGVQLIAAGHVHRPIVGMLGGAPVVVAPSTSHQIDLNLRPGAPLAIRAEPPMIGLYLWTPGDGIICHFSHVQDCDGPYSVFGEMDTGEH